MSGSPSQLSKRLFEKRLSDDQTQSGKPRKANGKLSFQLETCRKAVQLSELSTTYKVESGKPASRPHPAYQEFRASDGWPDYAAQMNARWDRERFELDEGAKTMTILDAVHAL